MAKITCIYQRILILEKGAGWLDGWLADWLVSYGDAFRFLVVCPNKEEEDWEAVMQIDTGSFEEVLGVVVVGCKTIKKATAMQQQTCGSGR